VSVPFILFPKPCARRRHSLDDDFLQAGPNVGWLISCLYFRTSSSSRTALASPESGLIGKASLYIFFGVHCTPLVCDAESKVSADIDAYLYLVFLAGESLFPMMLVLSSAATSLDIHFDGDTSVGSGSDWHVS
jgi:hypothetical protein